VRILDRLGLIVVAATMLLTGCGGSAVPLRADDYPATKSGAVKGNQTFDYTGKEQTFVVPAGVKQLTVSVRGGQGGGFSAPPSYAPGGFPGRVYAVIPVRPGDKLYVFVGGRGAHGGFNGGGAAGIKGDGSGSGYDGGGGSDVRMGGDALKDRIIVAAGGGGAGLAFNYDYDPGGDGGGLTGKSGGTHGTYSGGGGGGGTQSVGGAGDPSSGDGLPGAHGALGLGGSGGDGGPGTTSGYNYGLPGGGGGGGYYGGGGGGGSDATRKYYDQSQGGGGGGGSSYIEPNAITSRTWTGWRDNGDGRVVFSWK